MIKARRIVALGTTLLIISGIFAITSLTQADTIGDVGFTFLQKPSPEFCFPSHPGDTQTLNWLLNIANRGSDMQIVTAAYHDDKAGCTATIAQSIGWSASGQTQYPQSSNGQTSLSYNTGGYACGRVQLDAYFGTNPNGFVGYVINYGVDCNTAQPSVDLKANDQDGPISIAYNTSAKLSWTSQNVQSCSLYVNNDIDTNWRGVSQSNVNTGNITIPQSVYKIKCTGPNGQAEDSVTINVNAPASITGDIKCNGTDGPCAVGPNTQFTISWISQNANSCAVRPTDWPGTNSSHADQLSSGSRTYNLECWNAHEQKIVDSVTVNTQTSICTAPVLNTLGATNVTQNSATLNGSVTPNNQNVTAWFEYGTSSSLGTNAGQQTVNGASSANVTFSLNNLSPNTTYYYRITTQNPCGGSNLTSYITNFMTSNYPFLACSPGYQNANINQTVSFTAQGGNNIYSWSATGGTPATASSGASFSTQYSTAGSKTVTVSSAGQTAQCYVNMQTVNQLPTADIKANGSDGPITIQSGGTATITWTSQYASSCSIYPTNWTGTSGTQSTGNLTSSQTYTLNCTGPGGSVIDTVTVNVAQAPQPTVNLTATPSSINQGQSSALSWTSQNASSCSASGSWSGNKTISGSETVTPSFTTIYMITCSNTAGQQAISQAIVGVNMAVATNTWTGTNTTYTPLPTLTLTANPSTLTNNNQSTLLWSSGNATTCTASGGNWFGSKAISGSEAIYPQYTTTFYMTCVGPGGSVSAQTTVYVNNQSNQILPTVRLSATPGNINPGQSSNLSWSSTNANSCYVSGGWSGTRYVAGSEYASPNYATTYTITCTNQYGQATDSGTVFVNNNAFNYGPARNFQITKNVLNRTLNQGAYSNSIEAQGLDVLEFEIRVRNTDSYAGSITVHDILPQELFYVPSTTKLNGVSAADGITTNGLDIGLVNPNEERVVKFSATVFSGATQKLIINQVNAIMNSETRTGYANVQIKNRGQVLGAADIVTGPDNPLPWVLFLGFLISTGFYLAMFRFRRTSENGTSMENEFEKLVRGIREEEKKSDAKLYENSH